MASPDPTPPTRVRYGVLGFVCALSMITYLDRAVFASAAKPIAAAFGMSGGAVDLWAALTAFSVAYALFEIPTGWLGDVFGPRNTLVRIVIWWSLFTMVTALAGLQVAGVTVIGFTGLIVARFLFGIGEAGAYPNIARALHNWFPLGERGSAQGYVWMSGRFMGGLTPLLWTVLTAPAWLNLSWRWVFVLFGVVGLTWVVAFRAWFRNRPDESPAVNDAERALIAAGTAAETGSAHANVPWGRIVRSRNLLALCLMYAAMSYPWYFSLNYLPTYLEDQFDITAQSTAGAVAKGSPLLLGAVGCWLGGQLTDRHLRRTGNRRWARRTYGLLGHGLCAACFVVCAVTQSLPVFVVAIALTGFTNDLTMGATWATCQDIGRRHVAIVAGCMNMIGNGGAALSQVVVGATVLRSRAAYLADHGLANTDAAFRELPRLERAAAQAGGFTASFWSFAAIYAGAALLWLLIDATRPVVADESAGSSGG